jgi:hypothetical protein
MHLKFVFGTYLWVGTALNITVADKLENETTGEVKSDVTN